MSTKTELTSANLLEGLAGEIRSPDGPGHITKSFNEALITEFRANDGKIKGELSSSPFLLLTTAGARSGKERTTPLVYFDLDGRLLIIASRGGAVVNPVWFTNLTANPEVTVEVGAETYKAQALVIEGAERDQLYARMASMVPTFAEYQARTDRVIPVVELKRD
jgi:deazaflavin-dependent oxidoreductase (nitroreductase family)